MCDGCLGRGRFDIEALRRDYAALTAELVPAGGRPRDAHVSGGDPDAPVPLALNIDALQRDIAWTLAVWEPPVRELLGLDTPPAGNVRGSWAVGRGARLLARQVRALAALPPTWGYADGLDAGPVERDGVYAVASLRTLHGTAQRMLGATTAAPLTTSLPGSCPSCGATGSLLTADGSGRVLCAVCGAAHSRDEYRRSYGMGIVP